MPRPQISNRKGMGRARPSLKISRRLSPWSGALFVMRWLVSVSLVVAIVVGGIRFLSLPHGAGALDFTSHIIGVETGAVGVLGMAAADLDNDDDVDVVTAGLDGVKVYINNDDGTFTVKLVDDEDGVRVQIIDLDEDGSLDLLVALKSTSPSVKWYRNNGELEFSGTTVGTGTDGVAYAGDIDADGDVDIVTATLEGGEVTLRRWMNEGGLFTSTTLGTNTGVKAVVIADISGSGYQDIITGGASGVQRWRTTDGFTWSRIDIDDGNTGQEHLVVADVNGDNKEDIVAAEPGDDVVVLYRNLDFSTFERVALEGNVDAATVVIVDLDEDGDEDIVVAGQDDNMVYWFDNSGSEEFTKRAVATGLQSVFGALVVDVDGDDDFDVIAGDHMQGNVYWYERVRAKPVATAPDSILQSKDGRGRVAFETTLSDGDRDPMRIRVLYSLDGEKWYKPWLVEATPMVGSVDLKNSNGYQIGSINAIDTDSNSSVKLTMVWDTRSVQNTGGPILGDEGAVRLRIIPRDGVGNGQAVTSSNFRVDNEPPRLDKMTLVAISGNEAELSWEKAQESSSFEYVVSYGTNHTAVLERGADIWDKDDDSAMGSADTTGTTITGLLGGKFYSFKLFITDEPGNVTGVPSLRGTTSVAAVAPSPTAGLGETRLPVSTASPGPGGVAVVSVVPLPTSLLASEPPFLEVNLPPVADAGEDQVVNPDSLVILDGISSVDPEGAALSYSWRQISGPKAELAFARTATPSFNALGENEVYIFSLTVRDFKGLTATDRVTVATRSLPESSLDVLESAGEDVEVVEDRPLVVQGLLRPLDIGMFILSLLFIVVAMLDRVSHTVFRGGLAWFSKVMHGGGGQSEGRVVHYKTGEPIAGAQVLIYSTDGKRVAKRHTDARGVFSVSFPSEDCTIAVKGEGFTFSPAAAELPIREGYTIYSGGTLNVVGRKGSLQIIIPMKPTGEKISTWRAQFLHLWQILQGRGSLLFWPVLVVGSALNTFLMFWVPGALFLVIEVAYVAVVFVKIVLETRARPSYGLVRNAITHVPLDLAVVRLYERGTNRLVTTRVTDGRGKFFALPPPGVYTVTVTKPGYATFSREDVRIAVRHGETLQMKVNMMPLAQAAMAASGI